ncbi:MAG TPA: hypothetical protein PLH43_06800 [Acetivibrio sp.]|uniref:hypothetical protein n=1 Tax=Acetivibrio sp. TaxID=1872092 RepID=UPI002BCE69EB|nr:hypothetical protein [Acetivibrio sp.]HOM02521.1 hypothetical protein [Acetivibrio sp.]
MKRFIAVLTFAGALLLSGCSGFVPQKAVESTPSPIYSISKTNAPKASDISEETNVKIFDIGC